MELGEWILDDYIWQCDETIRLVYITLILSADKTGHTPHTATTLAEAARLPVNRVVDALRFLREANPLDKTVFAGRRVYVHNGTLGVHIPTPTENKPRLHTPGCPVDYETVKSMCLAAGMTEQDAEKLFHYYNSQGWVKKSGQPLTNLSSAIVYWKLQNSAGAAKTAMPAKKPKLPTIAGKNCSARGCGMPAVYKVSGEYPSYYCKEHIPERIKEKLKQEYDLD